MVAVVILLQLSENVAQTSYFKNARNFVILRSGEGLNSFDKAISANFSGEKVQ